MEQVTRVSPGIVDTHGDITVDARVEKLVPAFLARFLSCVSG